MINHFLKPFLICCLLLCGCFVLPISRMVAAADAVPVSVVDVQQVPVVGQAPIIVELFSSQACVFCPKADQLFADLIEQEDVIGLACHVDYFDVTQGALSQPFCTQRQSWYMEKLFAGPNYTPQMVINGAVDIVGYKFDQVLAAVRQAAYSDITPLEIRESEAVGTFRVHLPMARIARPEDFKLWLALYDKPHDLVIAEGRNKGKKATYYNIVSNLGSSDEIIEEVYVTPPLKEGHAGFVLILQNIKTGKIFAVGRHKTR